MIRPAARIIALLPMTSNVKGTHLSTTLDRLSRCKLLDRIVVIHSADRPLPAMPKSGRVGVHTVDGPVDDTVHASRQIARAFSPTAWRGGLGGACCYDEVLAARAMVSALDAFEATAGLIVSPDWPAVDPALCDAVIERHLRQSEQMKLAFTQAPPGLAGCLVERDLMAELDRKQATIGSLLMYQPHLPQGDPIGKDPCVLIDPVVRGFMGRISVDAPRWRRLLDRLGGADLTARQIVEKLAPHLDEASLPMPQQATLELTSARLATGPIVPQHHVAVSRPNIPVDDARRVIASLAVEPDVALTLGGLGDALLHPQWRDIIAAAREANIRAVHVETDLLVDQAALEALIESEADVISVRINADAPATYEKLMGIDAFNRVLTNVEWLLNHRKAGRPWIVPRLVKTAENVHELESFFDRWMYYCGHAVIEAPTTGGGLMPDLAVLDMSPPKRVTCRQLARRMTIHSDGSLALCDQDWRGGTPGRLDEQWKAHTQLRQAHADGCYRQTPQCAGCREWHRP